MAKLLLQSEADDGVDLAALLAAEVAGRRPELAAEALARIRSSMPYVDRGGSDWVTPVLDSIGAGIGHFCQLWTEHPDVIEVDEPWPLRGRDRTVVAGDLLLHGYRIVCEVVREQVNELLELATDDHDPVEVLAAGAAARRIEQALKEVVERQSRSSTDRLVRDRAGLDDAVLDALLGAPIDVGLATRSALQLGVDLGRLVRVGAATGPGEPGELAARIRAGVGQGRHGIVAARDDHVVLLVEDGQAMPAGAAHLGVGRPTPAVDASHGHADALAALRLAVKDGCAVVRFEDRWLDHVLSGAVSFDELAAAMLAPTAGLNATEQERLLQTLEAYLDANCSVTGAAERLHLHRESVRYRLRQVNRLWREHLLTAEGRLMLQLALKSVGRRNSAGPTG